jgi:hypothetical protein
MKWFTCIFFIIFSTGCDLVPSSYFKIEGAGGESAVKIVLTEGTETVVQGESFSIQVEIQSSGRSLRVIQGPNSQSVLEGRLATGKGDVLGTILVKAISGVARFEDLSFDEPGEKVLEIRLADDPEVAVKTQPLQVVSPKAELSSLPVSPNNLSEVSITVNGVGVDQYRYKFGLKEQTDCNLESGYSNEYLASKTLDLDVSALDDGEIKLCVIGGTLKGYWQELNEATTATWTKDTQAFTATLSGVPSGLSDNVVLDISVAGEGVVFYKYKLGVATTTDCSVMSGYSSQRMVSQKIIDDIASLADRKLRLCVIGGSSLGNWQQVATSAEWYKQVFKPADLNINGRIGMDFNPTDLSTMFKDPFGLEPVTAPGDSVGLILDTFQGDLSNLGAERLGNGTFDTNLSGWSVRSNITATWSDGEVQLTGGGILGYSVEHWLKGPMVLTEGHCLVEFDATWISGGSLYSGAGYDSRITVSAEANGGIKKRYRYITSRGTSGGTSSRWYRLNFGAAAGAVWRIDNVSVKELPGYHLSQPIVGARPVLAKEPASGRRNLLNNSVNFSTWSHGNVGTALQREHSANVAVAPDGTQTAAEIYMDRGVGNTSNDWVYVSGSFSITETGAYTGSLWTKAATPEDVGREIAVRHVMATNYQIITLTSDWQRFQWQETAASVGGKVFRIANRGTFSADNQVRFHVWGPQLEFGAEVSDYQYAHSEFDVTEPNQSDVWHLKFDGTDDFMSTSEVDLSSTDKTTMFAGIKKMNSGSANRAMIAELSGSTVDNEDSFHLLVNESDSIHYATYSRGDAVVNADQRADIFDGQSLEKVLLSAYHSIADSLSQIRRNGSAASNASGNKGAGNFGVYPLYVGMRAGTSLPFNGNLYRLTIVGDELDASEFESMDNLISASVNLVLP